MISPTALATLSPSSTAASAREGSTQPGTAPAGVRCPAARPSPGAAGPAARVRRGVGAAQGGTGRWLRAVGLGLLASTLLAAPLARAQESAQPAPQIVDEQGEASAGQDAVAGQAASGDAGDQATGASPAGQAAASGATTGAQRAESSLAAAPAAPEASGPKKARSPVEALAAAVPQLAQEGFLLPDFMRTGITFIVGDDNLRDNSQYSVAWDIGQRPEYEDFFERVYGSSNTASASTRLMLHHEEEGPLPGLKARIGLAFRMNNTMDNIDDKLTTTVLEDRSFIDLDWRDDADQHAKLTFYPYNADNIALGFFRGLRWGGREVFPQIDKRVAVPGLQALYGWGPVSAYAGLKTHAQEVKDKLNTEFVPKETVYSAYVGLAFKHEAGVSAHLQGARIDKGENPKLDDAELADPKDDQILAYGLDALVQWQLGAELGDPLGINRYGDREWIQPVYDDELALRARAELIYLDQRLMNADYLKLIGDGSAQPITGHYPALGAVLEAGARFGDLRLMALGAYRTLTFLTFDSPGVNPFETMSTTAEHSPELSASLHADYKLGMLWLGVGGGFKQPGTYTIFDEGGQQIVTVVKDRITSDSLTYAFDRTREVLPAGRDAYSMFFAKLAGRLQISRSVNALLEYSYTSDRNRAKLVEVVDSAGYGTGLFATDWDRPEVQNIHGLVLSVEGRF